MNRFTSMRPVVAILVTVGMLGMSARASAAERPYRARSTAVLNLETGDFVAAGNGTHLGNYAELGNVLISGDDLTALHVEGSATLTAANDDELRVAITGEMNFLTGTITATLTFEGAATGRFEDATGSASLVAQLQPDGTISVTVEGTIDY